MPSLRSNGAHQKESPNLTNSVQSSWEMHRFFQKAPKESVHQTILTKFATNGIMEAAHYALLANGAANRSTWSRTAAAHSLPSDVPSGNNAVSSATIYTSLNSMVFSEYLVNHSNLDFVAELTPISKYGADISYLGPTFPRFTENAKSAGKPCKVLDKQIQWDLSCSPHFPI